jgi:hypothetical protein
MSYVLYVVGFVIVIGGLTYGAVLLHTHTVDCSGFSRTTGHRDFDGCQGYTSKGSE